MIGVSSFLSPETNSRGVRENERRYPPPPSIIRARDLIKGGRLRKTTHGVISFAPFLVGASTIALGALLVMVSPAEAGRCIQSGSTGTVYLCSGAVNPSSDATSSITAPANASLTVRDFSTIAGPLVFGLDVSSGKGIAISTVQTTTSVTVDLNNDVSAQLETIEVDQDGTGAVTIVTDADVTSDDEEAISVSTATTTTGTVMVTANGDIMAGKDGINIDQNGTGAVNITTSGTITSTAEEGIFVSTGAATTGDVEIAANGNIMAQEDGIEVDHDGSGALTITTSGVITSTAERGIEVNSLVSSSTVTLNINADVSTSASGKSGIRVTHPSRELVTININNATVSSGATTAINLTAVGGVRVVMGDGAAVGGDVGGTGVNGDLVVELTGTADDNSFDIGNLEGGDALEKTGSGTWTLTGTPGANPSFVSSSTAMISEGRLVWDTTSNPVFASTIIADGATLEIPNAQTWAGSLTLSGVLDITGSNSNLALDTLTGSGGSVDIEVDFSAGDGDLDTPRLSITTVDGDPITVNVMAMGGFPEISEDDEDGAITIGNLISATTAEDGDFIVGRALNRGFDFGLVYDAANNRWDIVAQTGGMSIAAGGGIENALFETLPAALAQLASLESYHARLARRQYAGNMSVWGKIRGASSEAEPNSTSLATYDIENAEVEFGMNFPLAISNPDIDGDFTLGANVAFGDATTDVTVSNVGGEIATDSVVVGISVGWEDERAYFDGQLQYASFDNVLEADEKLADIDATAFSASAEVGYAVKLAQLNAAFLGSLPDITLIPSAQLQWSRIDFKDFMANETEVKLDRGSIISGRAGVAIEKQAQGLLLHGRANVIMPLDGEVGVNVADAPVTSEREDPVFDIGIGAAYEWNSAYAISADISTQQGSEIEGYVAKAGFKYEF